MYGSVLSRRRGIDDDVRLRCMCLFVQSDSALQRLPTFDGSHDGADRREHPEGVVVSPGFSSGSGGGRKRALWNLPSAEEAAAHETYLAAKNSTSSLSSGYDPVEEDNVENGYGDDTGDAQNPDSGSGGGGGIGEPVAEHCYIVDQVRGLFFFLCVAGAMNV